MDFGRPDGIEPPALGSIDLLEGSGERLGLVLARRRWNSWNTPNSKAICVYSSRTVIWRREPGGRESRDDGPRKPANIFAERSSPGDYGIGKRQILYTRTPARS